MIRVLNENERGARARDKAVVLTLVATALRLNELRELRLADVHIERPIEESYLRVRAETSKSRSNRDVRLDRIAAQAVYEYVKDWRPEQDGPLFLTDEGKAQCSLRSRRHSKLDGGTSRVITGRRAHIAPA